MHVVINYVTKDLSLAKELAKGDLMPDLETEEVPGADYLDYALRDYEINEDCWLGAYFDIEDADDPDIKIIKGSKEKMSALCRQYGEALKTIGDICSEYGCLDMFYFLFNEREGEKRDKALGAVNIRSSIEGLIGEPCICIADAEMYERIYMGFKNITERFSAGDPYYIVARKAGSYHW